jgi:hypothetical protein
MLNDTPLSRASSLPQVLCTRAEKVLSHHDCQDIPLLHRPLCPNPQWPFALRFAGRRPRLLPRRPFGRRSLAGAHGRSRSAPGRTRRANGDSQGAGKLRLRMGRRHGAPERSTRGLRRRAKQPVQSRLWPTPAPARANSSNRTTAFIRACAAISATTSKTPPSACACRNSNTTSSTASRANTVST